MKTLFSLALAAVVHIHPATHTITLAVGESFDYTTSSTTVVCDDPSLIDVKDVGTALRITGLKEGTTRCGFHHTLGVAVDITVYTVTVTPATP